MKLARGRAAVLAGFYCTWTDFPSENPCFCLTAKDCGKPHPYGWPQTSFAELRWTCYPDSESFMHTPDADYPAR